MDVLKLMRAQWDRVAGWGAIVLAAIFLFAGWLGVSRYGYPASQLPYIISGGLGGLFLVGVGAVLLLSADLKDEWRKLDAIERKLDANPEAPVPPAVDPAPVADVAPTGTANGRRPRGAPVSTGGAG
jgi:hypothetical protein